MKRTSGAWAARVAVPLTVAFLVGASAWSFRTEVSDPVWIPADGDHAAATLNGQDGPLEHYVGTTQTLTASGLTGNALANYRPEGWLLDARIYQVLARNGTDTVEAVFEVSEDGLTLAALSSPTTAFVADPGVTLSDEGVDTRDDWTSTGWMAVTGQRQADVEVTVRARSDGDCRILEATLTPQAATAKAVGTQQFDLTLCQGQGVRSLVHRSGSETLTDLQATGPMANSTHDPGGAIVSPDAQQVAGWQPQFLPVAVSDGLGTGEVSVYGAIPPAITRSGLVLVPNLFGQNLTAVRLPDPDADPDSDPVGEVLWRAHPGGTILATVAVGDLTVVATGHRELVAYDETGRQVWRTRQGDVVTALSTAGDDRLAASLASGAVLALDPRDGTELWRARMPGRSEGTLDATTDLVAVGDDQGNVDVFDAWTGDSLWRSSGPGQPAIALAGSRLATLWTTRLEVSDLYSGEQVWADTLPGDGFAQLGATGDQVVYGSTATTRVVDVARGELRGELPAVEQIRAVGDHVVLVDGQAATMITYDGTVQPEWDLGAPLESTATCHCALGPDALVFSEWDGLVVLR